MVNLEQHLKESLSLSAWKRRNERPLVRLENISKYYGSVMALHNINLEIYKQEFFSLLGGSGCGKTTLLRLLAGFEKPSSGRIFIDDVDVSKSQLYDLPVNMMFQSYALFPHMTVFNNIAFGLRQSKMSSKKIKERVQEMLELVHLEDFSQRYPAQLSGGQKQRVALARSLAVQPKLLLLDEPLAALDKNLRERTQFELVNIQEQLEVTFVMVTHDQEEAMTMSSRIGVMEKGQMRQLGSPGEIYEYPNSLYVAQFIGNANIFKGHVTREEADYIYVYASELDRELEVSYSASVPVGAEVHVMVRPEKMILSQENSDKTFNIAQGVVKDIAYLGDVSIYHVKTFSGKNIIATRPNLTRLAERPITWEDAVSLSWSPESNVILTG